MAHIRVIALCVLRREESILVFEAFDTVEGSPFYRPLGGGVEPGETTRAAVIREIREEIDRDVTDLNLLGTIENIFTLEGEPGHEIVFVYAGRSDEADYDRAVFDVTEDDGAQLKATWRPLAFFDGYHRLVPDGLRDLINERAG